jgi:Amino acid synthesis
MTIRKTVTLVEEINREYGAPAAQPLRRVAIAAVFDNPLAGKPAGADLKPLIDYSVELGASLTKTALRRSAQARQSCAPTPRQRWSAPAATSSTAPR